LSVKVEKAPSDSLATSFRESPKSAPMPLVAA
jgi:hypothetical protein